MKNFQAKQGLIGDGGKYFSCMFFFQVYISYFPKTMAVQLSSVSYKKCSSDLCNDGVFTTVTFLIECYNLFVK